MPDNLLAPDRLQAKIGKLPIWAWGLIGGTAALGAYYLFTARKRARTPNAGVNPAPGDNTLSSLFTGLATPEQTANAAYPVIGEPNTNLETSNALGDATLETNLTWLNRGIKIAVSTGNTALGATTALQKYLGGKPVNVYEENVVTKVLSQIGYPPEGAPLLVKAIKDATPTPAKPVTKPVTSTSPVVAAKPTNPTPKPTADKPSPAPVAKPTNPTLSELLGLGKPSKGITPVVVIPQLNPNIPVSPTR